MKTTIDIPEDMLRRAKVAAANRHSSLKELFLEGLSYAITHEPEQQKTKRENLAKKLIASLQAENKSPMKPLSRKEIYEK